MKITLIAGLICLIAVFFNGFTVSGKNVRNYSGKVTPNSVGDEIFLGLQRPCNGSISRKFDPEMGHYGIDYALKEGSPVYAAENGYVLFSDFTVDYGNTIIIVHGKGFVTIYKHCKLLMRTEREKVVQGDIIALSGNTGRLTTGPHLHFEVWKDGSVVNPEKYLIIN